MYPQQIHHYLLQVFEENNCAIIKRAPHYMTVQLTVEMDKRMMNRPYYWQYVESTDVEPCPAQLTFITDKSKLVENIAGEVIHFGSPRLNQIFAVTRETGAFIQMYAQVGDDSVDQTILTPWLGVNYKVSYCSDRTKEMLYSLGINLMTGEVMHAFQEFLGEVELHPEMTGNPFLLPYIIKPMRALERLDLLVDHLIQQDDHTWAEEANTRWKRAQRVLDYFYEDVEEIPECYEIEKKALAGQYETKIKIEVINGGVFYLK